MIKMEKENPTEILKISESCMREWVDDPIGYEHYRNHTPVVYLQSIINFNQFSSANIVLQKYVDF